ncbi:serine/threonine protein kinase [Cystobacter fuscus DSM 2262]|uniref:Serine/threonine protein kinase n=1 Tax=Cystobacter fuscus (strain ATCC 25194 / DSM 2262 / NBRC 100088 / M29) TaxID=1242864 RepID=S9P7E7_CYSF2|nr:serine/threonine-protein kinase [Cystobacter fuscus]EPX58117.1 serine/threonine protein kinase [Cystobacter fuscus DSM 2262]
MTRTLLMENDKTVPSPPGLAPAVLPAGWTVADRFVIQDLAGSGGMGFVYRALDQVTGRQVALKLLLVGASADAAMRFHREAQLLAGLTHPAIVGHVAHGTLAEGPPYLAMEWLEGEELSHRLHRGPLSPTESVAMVRRATEGLAVAHRQGVVHRDIKPSNLFLRAGRPEDVVLLDFGLARYAAPSLDAVTVAGTVVGTPGYMAPEQASSQDEIPPAADIFSLGCVLYECLTGQPPFSAPHFAAVLAKILFADPVPLRRLRPDLPSGLRGLVDRMLAKDLARRPADADQLLRLLAEMDSVPRLLSSATLPGPSGMAGAEQKLFSVLLVSTQTPGPEGATQVLKPGAAPRDALRAALKNSGAQVELLADGSLVATVMPERGTATDQAAVAARSALSFKEHWPEASVVLVTGVGQLNERLPVGNAMDRAGELLRNVGPERGAGPVVMDEVTAGLLGPGFQLSRVEQGMFVLRGEQLGVDESRLLLGKPTPCVGRDQELSLLEMTFQSSAEESTAKAVLVTASAGTGKSRLRHEFLRRMERNTPRTLVLLGRGDPMSAGVASGLLGQVFRRLCGIVEGEPLRVQRERLRERISRYLPEDRAEGTVEFIGELCAVPMLDEDDVLMRAARNDPRLMSTQVERALVTFLEAECAQHPVLLVLEDLHWSDALTVRRVDALLRDLAEHPFGVLALARPEVKDLFPFPWTRRFQEVPLQGLSRKASGRLVREVLGARVEESVVRWAVEMADGNALFLEELIRVVSEGRGTEAPETVLAVLQARLMRMESGVRQVLLAASIFGRDFWTGGVSELLGDQAAKAMLEGHLRALVDQEVIEPRSDSSLPTETSYRFRHALLQEAAYGLLSDVYRPEGHRLAATWLERMGGVDPLVLATHHQRGGQPERAVHYYSLAAERLFALYDLPGTMRCVVEALACGVEGERSVHLRALQAVVAFWMDDLVRSLSLGSAVLDELEPGSRLWCWLVGGQIVGGAYLGMDAEKAARLNASLWNTTPLPDAVDAHHWALACLGLSLVYSGARWELEAWLERMRGMAKEGVAKAWTRYLDGFFHYLFEPRPWTAFVLAEEGTRLFRKLGMERDALIVQTCMSLAQGAAGDAPGALECMRELLATGRRLEEHLVVGSALAYRSVLLAGSADPEHRREAHVLAREGLDDGLALFRQGVSHAVLAKTWSDPETLAEAEAHARKACGLLTPFQADVVFARSVLSGVLLARGNVAEAREMAVLGVHELERNRAQGVYAVAMYLALAEACLREGDRARAESSLRQALECVRARAADIPEPAHRVRFLRQVPENARVVALARECWGDASVEGLS